MPRKTLLKRESVALDWEKPSPAPVMSSLAHGLPSLYRGAYRLLGNKADAEDAVQDAVLAACKPLNQFRVEGPLFPPLPAIVINCARIKSRRRPRHNHLSLDSRIGEEQQYSLSETLMDDSSRR